MLPPGLDNDEDGGEDLDFLEGVVENDSKSLPSANIKMIPNHDCSAAIARVRDFSQGRVFNLSVEFCVDRDKSINSYKEYCLIHSFGVGCTLNDLTDVVQEAYRHDLKNS